jgi:prevent-host-death family protein
MYMSKTYPVAEARRHLSTLIERAASGRGPVYIGRRGRAEVALIAVSDGQARVLPRSLKGLCALVDEELARPDDELAAAFEGSLSKTEALLSGGATKRSAERRTRR